jgi:hypothetical protein
MTRAPVGVADAVRIPIRCNAFGRVVLTMVGAPPSLDHIDVDDDQVHVQLGYAFRTEFARANVESVVRDTRRYVSTGAHGWGGRWLVNGAPGPIAVINLREPVRAFVLGFPVQLRQLLVSIDDPDALAELLVPTTV